MVRPIAGLGAALALALAAPTDASAQGAGGPGCTNLPEYNRALGALQGMTSACDMTVAEACRIIAARGETDPACRGTAQPRERRGPPPAPHR